MSDGSTGERSPAVDVSEVRRVARLARLSLTDEEVRELAHEMSDVIRHFREIRRREGERRTERPDDGAAGGGVPGHGTPEEARAVLRSDDPDPDPLGLGPEELAPEWREGFLVVPRLAPMREAVDGGPGAGEA